MKIFEIFDIYFLILTVGYCSYTYIFVSKSYKKEGEFKAFNLTKKICVIVAMISIVFYIIGKFI